ncbi:unnamed protein product [Pedinophyceae sp. YPF-701]|nr:unnamed protein product [Pedinophyceae sp. YPF-701]
MEVFKAAKGAEGPKIATPLPSQLATGSAQASSALSTRPASASHASRNSDASVSQPGKTRVRRKSSGLPKSVPPGRTIPEEHANAEEEARPANKGIALRSSVRNYKKDFDVYPSWEPDLARADAVAAESGLLKGRKVGGAPADAGALRRGKKSTNQLNKERQAIEVNRENKRLYRKLKDISREPPARFHAPLGSQSLAPSARRHGPTTRPDEHGRPPEAWPPGGDAARAHAGARAYQLHSEGKRIRAGNATMKKKVTQPFANDPGFNSYGAVMGSVEVDAGALWPRRAELWDAQHPMAAAAREQRAKLGARARPHSAAAAREREASRKERARAALAARPAWDDTAAECHAAPGGPTKAMGVGSCAGCGRRRFWRGDGVDLFACEKCGRALYCSEACALIDWMVHRRECAWRSKGVKAVRGVEEESWVVNGAYAEVRRRLRAGELEPDEAWRLYQARREKELQREANAAELVKRDRLGMDTARPCCVPGAGEPSKVYDPNLRGGRAANGRVMMVNVGRRVLMARVAASGRAANVGRAGAAELGATAVKRAAAESRGRKLEGTMTMTATARARLNATGQ